MKEESQREGEKACEGEEEMRVIGHKIQKSGIWRF